MNPQPPPPPPPPMPHPPPHEPRVDYENGGLDPEKYGDQPTLILVMNLINTMTHLVLGAVTMLAIILANAFGATNSLRQHIYLCTIGYIVLMSQAVLTLSPFNGWSQILKRQHKRTIHWMMQIVGSVLAIAGSIVRINEVNNNFQTTHGILGLIAMLFTIISLLGGVINLFCCHDFKIMKVFHACMGILTLSVAYLSLIFGFRNTFYIAVFRDINSNLGVSFAVIGFIGTIISAFSNMFRRIFS